MRKFYLVMLIIFMGGLIVTGCQNNEPGPSGVEQPKDQPELIKAVAYESLPTDTLTLLDQFSCDLDLNGVPEEVALYTAAGRHENGEMMWDDGQDWLLVVRDGDRAYPLLSEYVQIGAVYFTVSRGGLDGLPRITAIVSTGAGLGLRTYIWDGDQDAFIEETGYSSPDDNFLFNSIPSY